MSESDSLAIIGISCLFPKADDLQSYWRNIKNGTDAITPIPASHWNSADYFNADPKAPDQTYAQRGGFLSPFAFNPMEFGIAPKDLEATDTTQLLGMVAAKQALIDAGYGEKPFNKERTSVILGVTGALELVIPLGARLGHPIWRRALKEAGVGAEVTEEVVQRISDSYVGWQENSFPGLLGNVVAGRIASRLDLGGTNCVVDAACASSMAALHLAAMELSSGKADMVLTGGVDTFNDIFMYMCFSKTPALSPTGDARPFDRACDGTILGEGLGILVLKRLADAERDGDRIHAVIKGIGSSSDGRGNAIYAPRTEGQRDALTRAYAAAGVSPGSIDLIEAHGTGTKVGDATEIEALTEVFRDGGKTGAWAALGSVKSQIGHTKAAAGVAGLIKAAMALENKVLPPTIKVTKPVEELASGSSPFYVNTQKRPWLPREGQPRRAGVSAFGFGGTNFHCVLEEHGARMKKPGWDGDVEIFAWSSDDREELRARIQALPAQIAWEEVRNLASQSRARFHSEANYRLLLPLARGTEFGPLRDAATGMLERHPEKSSWVLPTGASFGSGKRKGKLAALFPGQGSQYVGMFRDLACQFPEMLEALTEANRAFAQERPDCGSQRLSDFIYPTPAFDEETRARQTEALKETDVAQPALGAMGLGAMGVLGYFGVIPEAAAGHSYGELLALCGGGRLKTDSLHLLSNVRGRLMANRNGHSDRGAMLAVQASEEAVVGFVGETDSKLVIANRNSPSQFVLAGPRIHIEEAAGELARRSVQARVLQVSAAFHSTLVADAREPFAEVLENVPFSRGRIPVYANTTARPYPTGATQARQLLASQIVKPVDFMAQIETMHSEGVATFVEMGPGHVLSDLVQAILHDHAVEAIALDSSKGKRSGTFDLAVTLCRLAALGHAVDLSRWEEYPSAGKIAENAKSNLTIPLTGANYRSPQSKRLSPAQRPAITNNGHATLPVLPKTNIPATPPLQHSAKPLPPKPKSVAPANLQTAEQAILSLQKLQEQTAQLHRQFLENQDAARRTLETLLSQRRELLGMPSAVREVPPAPRTPEPIPSIPDSVPAAPAVAAAPQHSLPVAPIIKKTSPSETIAAAVLDVVAEKTGYPTEMLDLGMGLDSDLGIDSIKRVEIMAALRGRLPESPEIKPEHLGTLQTLRQVVDFLSPGESVAAEAAMALNTGGGDFEVASQAVLEVVAEKTGYPVEMLNLDMGLDSDLGVDSIKRVEIMAALRGRLPEAPEIKPEHLGTLQTLRQVVEFLVHRQQEIPAPDPAPKAQEAPKAALPASNNDVRRQIIKPVILREVDIRPGIVLAPGSLIWVTEDGTELAPAVEARLKSQGYLVRRCVAAEMIRDHQSASPAGLVILWPAIGHNDALLKESFRLIQIAGPSLRRNKGVLVTASRLDGVFGFGSLNGNGDPTSGGLAGLAKTARHEWPEVHCKAIDLNPEMKIGAEMARPIVEEMFRLGPIEVGLSGDIRHGLSIETAPLATGGGADLFQDGDVLVVTGGARGITATTTLQLARMCRLQLVLLGRSQLPKDEPAWLTGITKAADVKKAVVARANGHVSPKQIEASYREAIAQLEIRECLNQLRAVGATATYRTVDVRNSASIESMLCEIRRDLGPIRGLIHGAGVLADRRIEDKTEEQFDLVYGTKVAGLKNLLSALATDDLKLLALFSSYTGRFGRTGQADYAAANEVLNKLAQSESRRRTQCRVVSFNWGPWNGGMVSDGLRKIFEGEGVGLIEPRAGAEFFVREIGSDRRESVEILALATDPATGATNEKPSVTASDETEAGHLAFEHEASIKSLPCLESHVLNGKAVLPMALMIEWLAHAALHGNPGMSFHGFDNFRVLKGLVLEPKAAVRVSVLAGSSQYRDGQLYVPVQMVSQSGGRKVLHARADMVLTDELPLASANSPSQPRPLNGKEHASVYGNGKLFHGSHFQGIERVEFCSAREMAVLVKGAPSPKDWIRNPLRPAWLADPLVLDSSFQMMILWSWQQHDAASLPCAIKHFRQFAPAFPKTGTRVAIRIDSDETAVVTARMSFSDHQGNLLALAEGYECVIDKSLRDAFARNRLPHEQ